MRQIHHIHHTQPIAGLSDGHALVAVAPRAEAGGLVGEALQLERVVEVPLRAGVSVLRVEAAAAAVLDARSEGLEDPGEEDGEAAEGEDDGQAEEGEVGVGGAADELWCC